MVELWIKKRRLAVVEDTQGTCMPYSTAPANCKFAQFRNCVAQFENFEIAYRFRNCMSSNFKIGTQFRNCAAQFRNRATSICMRTFKTCIMKTIRAMPGWNKNILMHANNTFQSTPLERDNFLFSYVFFHNDRFQIACKWHHQFNWLSKQFTRRIHIAL